MFRLSPTERAALISQIAISKPGRGGRRQPPWACTEHGAIQAANVLNSPRAITMGIYVVRAFVQLREILASNKGLARKLVALERSLLALDLKTRRQFKEVYEPSVQVVGTRATEAPASLRCGPASRWQAARAGRLLRRSRWPSSNKS